MSRIPLRTAVVSLVAALSVVTTAAAVTGSTPDGGAHPYVGALVVNGSVACSGVLIAPNLFATAGHCGVDGTRVEVSLDSRLDEGWNLLAGTLEVDTSKGSDLAVVVLDTATRVTPADSPECGVGCRARPQEHRHKRRLRLLGTGCGRDVDLRRPPPRRRLAGPRRDEDIAEVLDPERRAVHGRLRRPSAGRRHGSLADVGRSQGLHRPIRGLPPRHGAGTRLPGPVRHASIATRVRYLCGASASHR